MVHLIHQHLIAKCYTEDFPLKGEEEKLKAWLNTLVKDVLRMQICIEPSIAIVEDEGNYGHTGGVGLTTSHAYFHNWSEFGYFALDIYSCKCFDVNKVIEFLKETRKITKISFSCFDREHDSDFEHTIEI